MAFEIPLGRLCRHDRVQLSVDEHVGQGLVRDRTDRYARRQFQRDLFLPPGLILPRLNPFDRRQVDAEFVFQKTSRIHAGCLRPFRDAHAAPGKVGRGLHRPIGSNVNR